MDGSSISIVSTTKYPLCGTPNYIDWYNSNNNIAVSGKIMKLLNGASKYYILGLCG